MTGSSASDTTADVRKIIESVPGCRLGQAAPGALGLSIRFTGWTVSLHEGGFAMVVKPPEEDTDPGELAKLLEPAVSAMESRRRAAMALGHHADAPLPYGELSHLMIEQLVLSGEPDLRNLIPALVSRQMQANAYPAQDGITDEAGRRASVRIAAPTADDPIPMSTPA
jgi:hypothetical protein